MLEGKSAGDGGLPPFEAFYDIDGAAPSNGHAAVEVGELPELSLEAVGEDSAGLALMSLRQVGEHIDVDFDLTEDLIRLRERQLSQELRASDEVLEDLLRIQGELLKTKDEVLGALTSLAPGLRDGSKALGLADSLVGRLDLITAKMQELVSLAGDADDRVLEGILSTAEELWETQQEAVTAFQEIFDATW